MQRRRQDPGRPGGGGPRRLQRVRVYVAAHSKYKVGVYSSAGVWTSIFGTGSAASIPNTYEWTYEPETTNFSNAPTGWCLKSGGCAQFFGGQTNSSRFALMWQWSGGGGVATASETSTDRLEGSARRVGRLSGLARR